MTVLDSLKKYFEENSREQIEKDWKESEKFDKVGPTCEEFLSYNHRNINRETIKQELSIETSDIIIHNVKIKDYDNIYSEYFDNILAC